MVDGAGYLVQGTGDGEGIELSGRSNVTIKNMEIKAFNIGIRLEDFSSNNIISGNNIEANNAQGILFYSSDYNNIYGNNITNNRSGIFLEDSSNNIIYHNNFLDIQPGYANLWDNGYPSGGNY